ncbi:hypothetical protein DYB28_005312, partial [Aphanomyces astaci]
MEGLKLSTNPTLQRHFAVSIVHFLVTFGISHSICCLKMVANICANLHATSGSRFRGAEAATKALVHVLTPAAVCDVAAPHAVLWSKLAEVWLTPHIPLLTIVLTEAEMTLLPRIITQMWPHVTSPSTSPPHLCHSMLTLPEAVAAAAARSPHVMAHVIALLKQEYCPQVLDHLVTSFPSACVPVVCDLIPLALSHFQGGSLSGLIPLLPLHGHLDIATDEVHLCRNPTNATTQTLLGVRAAHRIAVTGTPIQNSVVDIWSVCEFIMPGYLGDATSFRHHAVGPIAASRKPTATVAQKEAGALAITDLHAKIAPFVLRRTKDAVLTDLPPKSIQDIPCTLTPMQTQLYMAADSLDTAMATWRQRQQ